jgi:hypothetical protein
MSQQTRNRSLQWGDEYGSWGTGRGFPVELGGAPTFLAP